MREIVIEKILNSPLDWDRTNHFASALRAYQILSQENLLIDGEHVKDKIVDVIMHHPDIYKEKTAQEDAELIFNVLSENNILKEA